MATPETIAGLPRIESPCLSICAIDPAHKHCVGCYRSLKEVVQWGRMTDADRKAVMGDLAARKERMET